MSHPSPTRKRTNSLALSTLPPSLKLRLDTMWHGKRLAVHAVRPVDGRGIVVVVLGPRGLERVRDRERQREPWRHLSTSTRRRTRADRARAGRRGRVPGGEPDGIAFGANMGGQLGAAAQRPRQRSARWARSVVTASAAVGVAWPSSPRMQRPGCPDRPVHRGRDARPSAPSTVLDDATSSATPARWPRTWSGSVPDLCEYRPRPRRRLRPRPWVASCTTRRLGRTRKRSASTSCSARRTSSSARTSDRRDPPRPRRLRPADRCSPPSRSRQATPGRHAVARRSPARCGDHYIRSLGDAELGYSGRAHP